MKFKLSKLFAKHVIVADGIVVGISRHFYHSTFGVRGRYDTITRTDNYICEGTPGTGFFVHPSESHSYHKFTREMKSRQSQNFWTLVMGREPNFNKELRRVEGAFKDETDEKKTQVLSVYQNVLSLAKEEEMLQRVVRGIKDKMKGHQNKTLVSIISHYKSDIATLEHDVRATQLNVEKYLNDSNREAWCKVIEAFSNLMGARRIWSVYSEKNTQSYQQVFFDLGIFNYIQSPYDTPVMRDHSGVHVYIYPDGIIAARSSIDFECLAWDQIELVYGVVDITSLALKPKFNIRSAGRRSIHSDAISNLYGTTRSQNVGEIYIPKLNLRFFVNKPELAENFVNALNDFINSGKGSIDVQ